MNNKRKTLFALSGVSVAAIWAKPIVTSMMLPAHAMTSAACETPYSVGDIGPGGGCVFFVSNGGCNGLEAAPLDQSSGSPWGCGVTPTGATGLAIGTGAANTIAILGNACSVPVNAAEVASNYSGGGFNDWFLPSEDELNEMYIQLHLNGMCNFTNLFYWTSSELVAGGARNQDFASGNQFIGNAGGNTISVRAARAF